MSPGGITPSCRAWLRAADPETGWLPWEDTLGRRVHDWTIRRAAALGLVQSGIGTAALPDARHWTCWTITDDGRAAVAAPPAEAERALHGESLLVTEGLNTNTEGD